MKTLCVGCGEEECRRLLGFCDLDFHTPHHKKIDCQNWRELPRPEPVHNLD
jgi:hypothetical protein